MRSTANERMEEGGRKSRKEKKGGMEEGVGRGWEVEGQGQREGGMEGRIGVGGREKERGIEGKKEGREGGGGRKERREEWMEG